MNGKKPLNLSWRFKAVHVAFALPGRLMRYLNPIVGIVGSAIVGGGEGLNKLTVPDEVLWHVKGKEGLVWHH